MLKDFAIFSEDLTVILINCSIDKKLHMNLYNKVVLFISLNVHFVETLRHKIGMNLPCLFKHIWLYIQNCLAVVEYFFLIFIVSLLLYLYLFQRIWSKAIIV